MRIIGTIGGDLDGQGLQRLLVDCRVDLAPAPFGAAKLASMPSPFAIYLDPCAGDQNVKARSERSTSRNAEAAKICVGAIRTVRQPF